MKISISFRQAIKDDIAFLLELRIRTMTEHFSAADISMTNQQHIERIQEYFTDSKIILVNNDAVGLIKLGVKPETLHIRQFQILPEFQGKGIGDKVLVAVKKKAVKLQRSISLNVLLKNPAKALYLRHGFTIVDENRLEYQMECALKDC